MWTKNIAKRWKKKDNDYDRICLQLGDFPNTNESVG